MTMFFRKRTREELDTHFIVTHFAKFIQRSWNNMKKYISFIVLAFLVQVTFAHASLDNGPIFGQNISFPVNGSIPAASTSGVSTLPPSSLPDGATGMGGIGNAESSCAVVTSYHMYGSRGASVSELQTLLNRYANAQLPVSGFYGVRTTAAVKAFQKSQGIVQTGRQHYLTTAALNKVACGGGITLTTPLKRGYRGPAVVKLQQFLNTLGYQGYSVPVTGYYGPRTEAAVKAFQVAQGLPASGKAWTRTMAAANNIILGSAMAKANAPATVMKPDTATTPAAIPTETPSVTVVDDTKSQQAAVAESSGLFNASTLPWILLALAAGFGYIYGPWRKKEDEVTTPTPTIKV